MEFGLYHFADADLGTGTAKGWDAAANAKRLSQLLEVAELADQVGLDVLVSPALRTYNSQNPEKV